MNASVVVVGVEKTVGQQVKEFPQVFAARAAKAGRQIGNRTSREIAGQPIQQVIADPSSDGRLRLRSTRADDQVVLAETLYEPAGIGWRMLAVGIDDEDELALRAADAGLDGRAVALRVRMAHHVRAGLHRPRPGRVARTIVNDENLFPSGLGTQLRHDIADGVFLVQRRNDDGDRGRVSQAAAPRRRPR
jgi:hypothetical protein